MKKRLGEISMGNKVKRTERGWAGHFICSSRCLFRRNTLLEYEDKKWVVSTVGRLLSSDESKFMTIGIGRYYETMAFEASLDIDGYIDANVSEPIEFESNWAINDIKSDSEQRANDMHEKVVEELMEKIQL